MSLHRNRLLLLCVTLLWIFLFNPWSCNTTQKEFEENKPQMPLKNIDEVKEAHTPELMALPGVVGVYVGELDDHTPCIVVMVSRKTPQLEHSIPKHLEGHPVRIDETGEIKPMK